MSGFERFMVAATVVAVLALGWAFYNAVKYGGPQPVYVIKLN